MPWFRMDIHWYREEKLEEAAESVGPLGPLVLALFPIFLAMAKAQNKKGRAEFTYRLLTAEVFAEREQVKAAIEALVSASVLTCPQLSARGGTVAFDPKTWRKWNEAARKAESREELKAA